MFDRRSLLAWLIASGAIAAPLRAVGQAPAERSTFPTRPIRFVVPYPPGGGGDTVSRLLSGPMAELLGQPVVIENRAGAGGSIGAAAVALAEPDGHTMLFDALGHVINPHLIRDLPFQYERAFAPVSLLATQPIIVVGSPGHPARSLTDLLDRLRQPGPELSYGSSGNGTGPHLAAESLLRQASARAVHVAYRGAAPALQDVMAASVAFAVVTAGSAVALARDGKVIPLAVLSRDRIASLPGVPTAAEAGVPGFVFDEWNGLFVPARTPDAVIARLHQAVRHALGQAAVRERLGVIGAVPVGSSPTDFGAFLNNQRVAIARTIAEAGIKPT